MSADTRVADFYERYYAWRDTTGCLSKGFNMSVALSQPVNDALLSHALRATVLAHPEFLLHLIREGVENEKDAIATDARANGMNYSVGLVLRLKFADVVRHTSVAVDDAELARLAEVRTACVAPTPSWYLQVSTTVESQYLTFACNHVFFDGRSGVHFFDDLVRGIAAASELEGPLQLVEVLYDPTVDSVTIPPAGTSVVSLFDSPWWYVAKNLTARFVPAALKRMVSNIWGGQDLTLNPIFNVQPLCAFNPSCFRTVHLDAAQVTALLARCRAAEATMAPFLAASACRALDQSVVKAIGGTPTHVTQLMVCGRRFYPELAEKTRYGLFISVANDYVKSGSVVEEAAASLSQNLSSLLFDPTRFWQVGLLRYINIWNYMQSRIDKNEMRDTVEVSNVGLVRIKHGSWTVNDFLFSQGITTSHVTLSVASTPKGGMNIVISSLESLHQLEVDGVNAMEMFFEKFTGLLKSHE